MDEDRPKGRTWNGYVCPGCRTVFRVAADFDGADVMCPSCKEKLRLPKTPEEVRPHTIRQEKPSVPAAATNPVAHAKLAKFADPTRPPDPAQESGPSAHHAKPSANSKRLKLTLALLVPVTAIISALLIFQPDQSTPDKAAPEHASLVLPVINPPETPAPLPPPVAVSEMPEPAPPAVPETEESTVPEVAVVQPVEEPAAPISEPVVQNVESVPEIPAPSPAPVAAEAVAEPALVAAIPATPEPAPELPTPPPDVRPEPEAAAAPADLVHNVVRGDTLNKISRKYKVGIATIKKANGMKGDAIMPGQKLKIRRAIEPAENAAPTPIVETPAQPPQPTRSHTVVRGDTLERIARKHRVTPQQIMQANGMTNDVVRLGRKLVIPAAP